MTARQGAVRRPTPWDADPLSWLAVPNLPLSATAITGVYGALVLTVGGQAGPRPLAQWVGLALAMAALLSLHISTRPKRGALSSVRAATAVALMGAGFLSSAYGYRGEPVVLELWWAPLASCLLLLSMAPYCDPLRLFASGSALLSIALLTAAALPAWSVTEWPPFSSVAIIATPVVFGTAGGIAFIRTVTTRLARWSERPWREREVDADAAPEHPADDPLAADVDERTTTQLAEAVVLLSGILDRDRITPDDQQSAALVATRLRSHLLAAANDSWLERTARSQPVRIDDPERLADRLGVRQRTALRAFLDALLDDPASGFVSARIELKSTSAGEIAVALRILTTLPEGRRVTYLAPYYVSLQSTVSGIRWRDGASIAVDFTTTSDTERVDVPLAQRQGQRPE